MFGVTVSQKDTVGRKEGVERWMKYFDKNFQESSRFKTTADNKGSSSVSSVSLKAEAAVGEGAQILNQRQNFCQKLWVTAEKLSFYTFINEIQSVFDVSEAGVPLYIFPFL